MSAQTITFDTSHLKSVGAKFILNRKAKTEVEIIGYHVEFNTDTQETQIEYRLRHYFMGQPIVGNYPRASVDMATPVVDEKEAQRAKAVVAYAEGLPKIVIDASVPTYPTDKGGTIDLISAAEAMYGTNSKQHKAAIKRFGIKK